MICMRKRNWNLCNYQKLLHKLIRIQFIQRKIEKAGSLFVFQEILVEIVLVQLVVLTLWKSEVDLKVTNTYIQGAICSRLTNTLLNKPIRLRASEWPIIWSYQEFSVTEAGQFGLLLWWFERSQGPIYPPFFPWFLKYWWKHIYDLSSIYSIWCKV